MTTHALRITIAKGEMTYGRAVIVCSDNGGQSCAVPVAADECAELASDRANYIAVLEGEGNSTEDAEDQWDEEAEHLATTCDVGWWWDGEHTHPGPVGSGCNYVEFHGLCGQDCLDLTAEVSFDVPVTLGRLDWEDTLRVTPATAKETNDA
jgi:hypothetical protein